MAIILSTSDLLEVAGRLSWVKDQSLVDYLIEQITTAQSKLADLIAEVEQVTHTGTEDQGTPFAGLCSTFEPGADDTTSDLLQEYDEGGDWR